MISSYLAGETGEQTNMKQIYLSASEHWHEQSRLVGCPNSFGPSSKHIHHNGPSSFGGGFNCTSLSALMQTLHRFLYCFSFHCLLLNFSWGNSTQHPEQIFIFLTLSIHLIYPRVKQSQTPRRILLDGTPFFPCSCNSVFLDWPDMQIGYCSGGVRDICTQESGKYGVKYRSLCLSTTYIFSRPLVAGRKMIAFSHM